MSATILLEIEPNSIILELDDGIVLELENEAIVLELDGGGPQGIPGPAGSPHIIVPFAFTDTSIILLVTVPGDFILDTELEVLTPFDDPAATLSIGTAGDNNLVIDTSENLPGTVGNYGTQENFEFLASETVRIFISPGTSTQGSGRVTLSKK